MYNFKRYRANEPSNRNEVANMKHTKRILTLLLAVFLLAALTACFNSGVTAEEAAAYLQGDLDAYYKGIYDEGYIDMVEDMTLEKAKAAHQENVEIEAENLVYILGVEYPNDAVAAKAQELMEEIYSHAKYTVGKASKMDNGDYALEVKVSPIEVVSLITDELCNEVYERVLADNDLSFEEAYADDDLYIMVDAEYGMAILAELEALMPQLTYGTEQSIMFQLARDDDGYYSLAGTAYQTLDEKMIDYFGSYMN